MPIANEEERREYYRKYRLKHRERLLENKRAWDKNNKEKRREYRRNTYHNNREQELQQQKEWRSTPTGIASERTRTANRCARKLQATIELPEVLSEIQEIYANCPEGHHVDHIVPLQGELVCGLHVPANLQYLPAEENLSKSNKFEVAA